MHQSTFSSQQSRVFNGRYVIKKKISAGSFGVVFHGFDKITKEEVALKLEKEDNEEVKSIDHEIPGVPRFYWAGREQEYNVMVIQLLGKDLAYHFKNLKKFSLKTVIQLAQIILPIIEKVHNKGVVHRDLKPENILLGMEGDPQQVYLVDFGISKIYKDHNNRHIERPFKENKPFIGTTRYASIAAHKGIEITRKDDLESFIYVLLYFLKGQLPWQSLQVADKERTKAVGEMKMKIDLHELCKGLPHEFLAIFEYLRKLQFRQTPDYTFLMNQINKIADVNSIICDGVFDWSEQKQLLKNSKSLQSKISSEFQSLMQERTPLHLQGSKFSNLLIWSLNEQGPLSGEGANNMLLPPDTKNKRKSLSPHGFEKQNSSNSSLCMSRQGSYSSMKIKYVPTYVCIDENKKSKQRRVEIKKSTSLQIHDEKKELLISMPLQQEIDENLDDIPLWNRYYKLKVQETNQFYQNFQKFSS